MDIANLAMRPHSETLRLAAWAKSSPRIRYLICSQALTRNSVPRTTGPVLAMHESGETAENPGRVLLSMRWRFHHFAVRVLAPGLAFFGRLEITTRSYAMRGAR